MSLTQHAAFGIADQIWLSMPMCTADHHRCHAWLRRLHPNGSRDVRALRDSHAPICRSHKADDVAGVNKFVSSHVKDRNLYVGVATRDGKGRTAEHCLALHALFCDLDFEKLPEVDARRRLEEFPLPPSAVIASGGGLHVYWWLRQPIDLQNGVAPYTTAVLKALAGHLGADAGSTDVAHILRIPGTLNYKYDPPRPVKLETLTDHEYEVGQFLNILGEIKTTEDKNEKTDTTPIEHGVTVPFRKQLARRWLSSQKAAVENQGGNKTTYKVSATVGRGFDLSRDDAYEVMQDWNSRCTPAWSEKELRELIDHGIKHGKGKYGYKLVFHHQKTGQKNIIADSQFNVELALAKLQVELSYDAFALKARVQSPEYDGALDDAICRNLRFEIDRRFHFRSTKEFLTDFLGTLADQNTRHPVKEFFDRLQWDGQPRLDRWLIDHAGSPDTEFVRTVSAIVLIAVVRRVRQPGCKYDELLTLENPLQGTGKSSLLATICPRPEWFSDDLPLGVDSKQVIERTVGKLIIEAADLHGFKQRNAEELKSFLSRQVDGPVRLAYGRLATEVPRQFVIAGTTNYGNSYLTDSTGNRRFWGIPVKVVNLETLKRDRDQLWAEAAYREAAGESVRLPERLWSDAAANQEERRAVDPWKEQLVDHFESQDSPIDLYTVEYLPVRKVWAALGADKAIWTNNTHADRVTRIMTEFGFKKKERFRYTEEVYDHVTNSNGQVGYESVRKQFNDNCWVRNPKTKE